MTKMAAVWLAGGLMVGATAFADAGGSGMTGQQQMQQQTQGTEITGVVTKIDKGSKELTVVLPAGTDVNITRMGKSVIMERGVNLVSLKAPVMKNATIWRDGKQANLSDIKEGDVVRTSFDASKSTFGSVAAVSEQQIDKDVTQARQQLKQNLNQQLDKGEPAQPQYK